MASWWANFRRALPSFPTRLPCFAPKEWRYHRTLDNVTHTLAALALSRAGLNRMTRFATVTLIIGANLPDADLVSALGGGATYLKYHRGITHSLLGAAILATALGALIYLLGRRAPPAKKPGPPLDARWLLAIAWMALAS